MSRRRHMERHTPSREHFFYYGIPCPHCNGKGGYSDDFERWTTCKKCDGTGKMVAHVVVEFTPDYDL